MTLLYIDMLGVKSLWHTGGRESVEKASDEFKTMILSVLKEHKSLDLVEGGIETDASGLVFKTTNEAIRFGIDLYLHMFLASINKDSPRPWIRGAIMPYTNKLPLRTQVNEKVNKNNIKLFNYSGDLLNAMSAEKSGMKGMRLVVFSDIITEDVKKAFKIPLGKEYLFPFKKLDGCEYPGRLNVGYQDILWMMINDQNVWKSRKLMMEKRLRWSSHNAEEFSQAAATQLLFHECAAIFESVSRKK
jgi:hypothetical protein